MRIRLTAICLSLLISSPALADLRIFDVGLQHQQEVFVAVRQVLAPPSAGGNPMMYGTVERLPNGQILVNAQPEALEQLEQVIKAIRERPVAAAPRVTLRYWAVLGTQAAANATNAIGTAPPPVLNDVLAELKRLNGNLTFRVIGTAAVTTDSGQEGEVTANTMSVRQETQVQGETLNAYMRIHVQERGDPNPFTIGHIELRTTLRRGEFVVLGESHFKAGSVEGPLSYIVHWAEDR
jgi:hypothetical protein